MQKPDAIHLPSQVTRPPTSVLRVRGGFLAGELGGVVDQQAGARVGGVVTSKGAQGIGNRALLLTDVLLEVTQFTETIDNDQARLDHLNKGVEVEK